MPSSPPSPRHRRLRDRIASPDYFARVSEATLKLETAADVGNVIDRLKETVEEIGADVAVFLSYFGGRAATSFRFFLACDPRWYVDYEQCAWYADDPWLQYATHHAEPILANDVPVLGEAQAQIVKVAERHGFNSTVIVPAPARRQLTRLGVLFLGSREEDYFEADTLPALSVAALPLAMSLLNWSNRDARDELLRSAGLTPDDLVLLAYEWRRVSTKQIAKELETTPLAIHSRFQRVMAKMGVRSRRRAAQLAAEYGLI